MSEAYHLVIQQGPGQGQTYAVEKNELIIGRGIDCDLSIIEPGLSRHHVRLFQKDGRFYIEDLKSTNGTWLNDVPLNEAQPLEPGARIRLGQHVTLVFEKSTAEEVEKTMTYAPDILKTAVGQAEKEATGMTASGSKVFISYSRRNKEFVQKLHGGLRATGMNVWVDWEGIPLTADWWQEIQDAIEGADGFVFVISPDSLASEVCAKELQTAISSNKRLIPILHIDPEKGTQIPDQISSHNWVFMKNDDELRQNLPALVESINTDLTWVQAHTRLLVRAVEWLGAERRSSLLLRGDDLGRAEQMVAQSEAGKKPALNDQQLDYIRSSREEAKRTRRRLIAGVSVTAVITLLLIFSVFQTIRASNNEKDALAQKETANAASTLASDSAQEALAQKEEADKQREIAVTAQANAENQQAIAEDNEREARAQKTLAEESQRLALARGMSASAQVAAENQPPVGILLSVQALRTRLDENEDPLPISHEVLRQTISEVGGQPFPGHEAEVRVSAFNPNTGYFVTGDAAGQLIQWDPFTPQDGGYPFYSLGGESVLALAFSPDGQWMAAGSDSGRVVLWNLFEDPSFGSFIEFNYHNNNWVTGLVFSPDGRWLASSSWDYEMLENTALVDLFADDIEGSVQLFGEATAARALAFSPDSRFLATGYDDGQIYLWTIPLDRPVDQFQVLAQHEDSVLNLTFSPDGYWLASGSDDTSAILWIMDGDVPQFNYRVIWGHQSSVSELAFDPESSYLATGDVQGVVRLWFLDGDPTNDTTRFRGHTGRLTDLLFSSDGQTLISSSRDGTARLWPIYADEPVENVRVMRGHSGSISDMSLSLDGHWLVTTSEDHMVRVWDMFRPNPAAGFGQFSVHNDWVRSVAISPDSHWLATAGDDNLVYLWELAVDSTFFGTWEWYSSQHTDWVRDLAFSPDGSFLASASDDATVKLWDMNDPAADIESLIGHTDYVFRVEFSPNGRWIGSGGLDGQLILWDFESGDPQTNSFAVQFGSEVNDIAFSADSRWAAAGSWDGTAALINLDEGGEPIFLQGHENGVLAVAFSPDGRWLATGDANGVVYLWSLEDEGASVFVTLPVHTDWVRDLEFSPDSRYLASGSDDTLVFLWDLTDRDLVESATVLYGHTDWVNKIAFNPDGNVLASASDDSTVRLWNLESENPVEDAVVLRGHTGFVMDVTFSSDGRWVVSGSADGDARVWPLETDFLLDVACAQVGRNLTQEEWEQFVGKDQEYRSTCSQFGADLRAEEDILFEGAVFKMDEGDITGAAADYAQIEEIAPGYLQAGGYNRLCWYGGLWNEAELVIEACDRAVELNPESGWIRDSRGLVRALLGDLEGAAEDFRFAVAWAIDLGYEEDPFIDQRSEWADELEAGRNPIDEALLEELRLEG